MYIPLRKITLGLLVGGLHYAALQSATAAEYCLRAGADFSSSYVQAYGSRNKDTITAYLIGNIHTPAEIKKGIAKLEELAAGKKIRGVIFENLFIKIGRASCRERV